MDDHRRWAGWAGTLAALLALAAAIPAMADEPADQPGRHAQRLYAAGHWWWFHVHVPRAYDAESPLPLVILLHGTGGSAGLYLDKAGWARKAEQGAFLVVAPEGLPLRPGLEPNGLLNPRLWASGQHASDRPRSRVDDLGFFDALLAKIEADYRVDHRRIYVVGHSNGAAMGFRLAAARSDRIAALAAVSGHCWVPNPKLTRPVPTLWIVGDKDPLMPYEGGLSVLPWEVRRSPAVETTLKTWTRANDCELVPVETLPSPTMTVRRYATADGEVLLELDVLHGHGHGWPGHPGSQPAGGRPFFGPSKATLDGTDHCWEFLRRHTLGASPRPSAAARPAQG